jgi:hypothetical protein
MKLAAVLVLSSLVIPSVKGQPTDPDQTPPVGSPSSPPQAPTPFPTSQPTADADRPISWKLLLPNLVDDQEHIWAFPARLVRGQSWVPSVAVLGTAAGLVAFDPDRGWLFPPHFKLSRLQ